MRSAFSAPQIYGSFLDAFHRSVPPFEAKSELISSIPSNQKRSGLGTNPLRFLRFLRKTQAVSGFAGYRLFVLYFENGELSSEPHSP